MTLVDLDVEVDFPRTPRGKGLVVPECGGKPIRCERVTRLTGMLKDDDTLNKWREAIIARGFESNPELLVELRELIRAGTDGWMPVQDLVEKAFVAGGGTWKRDRGTLVHQIVAGGDFPDDAPEGTRALVDGYQALMDSLGDSWEVLATERFVANECSLYCGQYDGIAWIDASLLRGIEYKPGQGFWGIPPIAPDAERVPILFDYKTGRWDGLLKSTALQMSFYRNADPYDPAPSVKYGDGFGERVFTAEEAEEFWPPSDDAVVKAFYQSPFLGAVIHLTDTGSASLSIVDLDAAPRGVALSVADWRRTPVRPLLKVEV